MRNLSNAEPNMVGDVVYDVQGVFGPRYQPHLQLVYVYNGAVEVSGVGFSKTALGGEAFFMLPGLHYTLQFDAQERVRHGWVDIINVLTSPAWLSGPGREVHIFKFTERMQTLAQLANEAPREADGQEGSLRMALGWAIVEEALMTAGLGESADEHLPPAVVRAQNTMVQMFPENLCLDDIAKEAGVSKAHLIRLFRESLGVTPVRRLWEIRVEAGSRLLRETGLQIQEIADRCGFPSPYHFSRLIKQAHGVSPREYRRQEWGRGAKEAD